MPDLDNIQRPDIPYVPENALPNNNRYQLVQGANQPPTGTQFDGDDNYIIDVCRALKALIDGTAAGILPGSENPLNVNKFPVTDGQTPATISWTQVLTQHLADLAVTTAKIAQSAVTTDKLGPGAVQANNIYPQAVTNPAVADNAIATPNIQDGAVISSKIPVNTIGTNQMQAQAITAAQIANNTITNQQIANNTITNQQLAIIAQMPVGIILDWAGTTGQAPPGWVQCNGQAISRVQYATLFAVCGITYGTGDGVTTFNVPDLRGRATFGVDMNQAQQNPTGGRIVNNPPLVNGSHGGEEMHTLITQEMPSHQHAYSSPGNQPCNVTGGVNNAYVTYTPTNTAPAGGDQPHNNMPPYMLMTKIIYAGV